MPYKFNDIKKRLNKLWFQIVRQKWSHVIFSNWKTTFPIPNHWWQDISNWVENKIISLLNISKKEFKDLI